jgi:hypothetical protein
MARVIEDGEWEIPVLGWRFHKRTLDHWCDGKIRELVPNRDFPPAMPVDEVKRRLRRSAFLRDTTVNVWPKGNGNIMIQMFPEGSSYRS